MVEPHGMADHFRGESDDVDSSTCRRTPICLKLTIPARMFDLVFEMLNH